MKSWLKKRIAELTELRDHPEPDEVLHEGCASVIREAADRAATAGLLHLYDVHKNVKAVSPRDGVAILASMLVALQQAEGCREPRQGSDKGPFSIEQAAARLGVSKSKAYQDARAGLLPHKRIGRRIVVDLDQLNTYRANIEDEPPTIQTTFRHLS